MTSTFAQILLRMGIFPESVRREAARWVGMRDLEETDEFAPKLTADLAHELLDSVLQDTYDTGPRETVVDATAQFLRTIREAELHYVDGEVTTTVPTYVGTTPTNTVLLPWFGEDPVPVLTNGVSHLNVGGEDVYFSDAYPLFYGKTHVFLACVPATRCPHE